MTREAKAFLSVASLSGVSIPLEVICAKVHPVISKRYLVSRVLVVCVYFILPEPVPEVEEEKEEEKKEEEEEGEKKEGEGEEEEEEAVEKEDTTVSLEIIT